MKSSGELYGHGHTCSWMMESVWEHPVCSLWIHSGGTLVRGIGELTKQNQVYREELGHLLLFSVDSNLISVVTIPR